MPLRHVEPRHHIAGPRHDIIGPRPHLRHPGDYAFPVVAGVTVYSGWPSYGSDDSDADARRSYVVPAEYPAATPIEYPSPLQAAAAVGGPAVALRHACRSDTETVPSERGGKSNITVTRCYWTQ